MGNMSYCRFRNTLLDLQDCRNAMQEISDAVESDNLEPLSHEEESARKSLIELCSEIFEEHTEG